MEIKTIIFDLGGVVITLDQSQAIQRFKDLGLADAEQRLDPYQQSGIFGQLEEGLITAEDFRREFSMLVGYEATMEQCAYAWQGYAKEVPQRNLAALQQLRQKGYRVVLLSNTNPFMMQWAESTDFDGHGHPLSYYFDACYLSYQLKMMKPSEMIFREVLRQEKSFSEATAPCSVQFTISVVDHSSQSYMKNPAELRSLMSIISSGEES